MKAWMWIQCAVRYPRLFLCLVALRLWGVWLDVRIWRLQRVNSKLRAQMAELQASIAIAKAKRLYREWGSGC